MIFLAFEAGIIISLLVLVAATWPVRERPLRPDEKPTYTNAEQRSAHAVH